MTASSSADADKIRISLTRPVPAHGEEIAELSFREPTGGDIARCGNPVKFNFSADPPEISFDEAKMAKMLSLLAGVPESSIARLTAADWMTSAYSVAGFFFPGSTTPSNSAAG